MQTNMDLILEGGGSRGFFSLGALKFYKEKNLEFNNIYGVSAGSIAGALFLSDQIEVFEEIESHTGLANKDLNPMKLVDLNDAFLNFDKNVMPFDFDKFKNSKGNFYAVAMNADTGQAEYIDAKAAESKEELFEVLSASCAVPAFAIEVMYKGQVYYDGGYTDPIPVFKSWEESKNKKLIILTQDRSFIKKKQRTSEVLRKLVDYQSVVWAIESRHVGYNNSRAFSFYMEDNEDALVLAPSEPVKLTFMSMNKKELLKLYQDGYMQAKESYSKLEELNA